MEIVRAEPEDAGRLTAIAFAAKRHWGYPEEWMELWRDALTIKPEFISRRETYAAILDECTIGFYALVSNASRLELQHLWVLPQAMGRGIGRALFSHAPGRAKELGFRQLEIESDPNAEGFYIRMGAHRTGLNVTELAGQRRELPALVYDI